MAKFAVLLGHVMETLGTNAVSENCNVSFREPLARAPASISAENVSSSIGTLVTNRLCMLTCCSEYRPTVHLSRVYVQRAHIC